MNKKVLFISYLFPPIGGGGVLRVLKWTKYLPKFGWQPYVVTPRKGFSAVYDQTLLADIPKEVKVFRVNYLEPVFWLPWAWWRSGLSYIIYRWFLFPDRQILWFWPALFKAWRLIKSEKIKVIVTSSSPITDHFIGWALKRLTGVRWVADWRDEWVSNPYAAFPSIIHQKLAQYFEKKLMRSADQIATISEPINQYYRALTGEDKVATITNGFDPEDFPKKLIKRSVRSTCQILYAGALYRSRQSNSFWQALKALNLPKLKPVFLGQTKKIPHQKAVRAMCRADILLLISSSIDTPAIMSGKVFEYLAARRPILCLASRAAGVSQLVKQLKVGEVADPANLAEVKNKLKKMYQKWEQNQLSIPKINLDEFNRENLTEKLTKILEKKQTKIKICMIGNLQSPNNIHTADFLAANPNTEIHFITPQKNAITGVKTDYIPHRESSNIIEAIFNQWWTAAAIRRIVKRIKPDIIHGQSLNFYGIWAMLSGIHPLVVMIWGSDVNNFEKYPWPERYLIRQTLQKADLILTNSMIGSGRKAIQIGAAPQKMRLLQFGVDLNIFKKTSTHNLRKALNLISQKVIFCPRSIKTVYNIDIVIQSFAEVVQSKKNLILILMAPTDDVYGRQIKKQIVELKIQDKIICLAQMPNPKMADYYNLAEVVISVASSEGNSSSFMEALACEKKMVVSNLPVLKEWPGKYWRAPVRDVHQTAQKLLEALDFSSTKFRPWGQKNRALVAQQGEIKSNFAKLAGYYRELI